MKHVFFGCGICLLAISACEYYEPDVGEALAGTCDPADSNPDQDISFRNHILPAMIRPLGEAGCSCHLPSSSLQIGISIGGLNAGTLESLRRGGINTGSQLIVPGDPCASLITQKVSETPPLGARMPLDGPPYLSDAERQAIHDWIAEGAKDN